MIKAETVEKIKDSADIMDVVSDFVTLKKRGSNFLGLCPFHNEKTPSFTVSVTKGIYKCFGCGKAGNSISFIMEHEQMSYPEALRYLAGKYNIPIEEKELTAEDIQARDKKESLFIVNQYAQEFFHKELLESREGQQIGLSYFKERGLSEETIKRFKLGYCPEAGSAFSDAALKAGYRKEFLLELGISKEKNDRIYDFYRGRVLFSIHNLGAKVVGFGARTLKKDKKIPKYLNSPESDIYNKSKILYGLYQARKSIHDNDECLLVEGYTDVLSLAQAGIENVVSSSGTSLTEDQVRLIKRYTPNVTILYDGDAAGIKAALRGMDLILEQGMNVKIVLFPEGEDPDSFVRKTGAEDFRNYLKEKAKDFIFFKADLLFEESEGDPVKRAALIKDIVESISKIPDQITRALYIRETASLLKVEEALLIREVNTVSRKKLNKEFKAEELPEPAPEQADERHKSQSKKLSFSLDEHQERDIVRLLLEYHHLELDGTSATEVILNNIQDINIQDPLYNKFLEECKHLLKEGLTIKNDHWTDHVDKEIKKLAIDLLHSPYELSHNWEVKHNIVITEKDQNLRNDIEKTIALLKIKKLFKMREELQEQMLEISRDNMPEEEKIASIRLIQQDMLQISGLIREFSETTGSVVFR